LGKCFETKHNIISKISMKSADSLMGCSQQVEMWRGSHEPASLICLELGFDKPKKIWDRSGVCHVNIMRKRWRWFGVRHTKGAHLGAVEGAAFDVAHGGYSALVSIIDLLDG
jgi:hypothetical protein